MGKFVLKKCFIEVDAVDLSNFCSSVTVESTFDEVDVTGFGSNYKEIAQGMGDATITLEVFQDFAAMSVNETLWPLSQSGEAFDVVIRPTSDSVSVTNPEFHMSGKILGFSPIAGAVGDASTTSVPIRNADQAGLTMHTS